MNRRESALRALSIFGGLALGLGIVIAVLMSPRLIADAESRAEVERHAERVTDLVDIGADDVRPLEIRANAILLNPEGVIENFCTDAPNPEPRDPEAYVVVAVDDCYDIWTVEARAEAEARWAERERDQRAGETMQYVLGDLHRVTDIGKHMFEGEDRTQYAVLMPEYEANGIMRDAGFQARAVDASVTATVIGDTLVFEFPADEDGAL